jgi:hypothetical protein
VAHPRKIEEPRRRYAVGDRVLLAAGYGYTRDPKSHFTITQTLPDNGSHFMYRIRNEDEKFERVAPENVLLEFKQ